MRKEMYGLFIFLFLFSVTFVSSQGMIRDESVTTFLTGNLTELSQLNDTNINSPLNLQLLQFKSSDNKWNPYSFNLGDYWNYNYNDLINSPTSLSYFTDDLGNRGYTNNLNFTNGAGYITSATLIYNFGNFISLE